MAEVVWANLEMQDFFDHRREVSERADDPESRSIGGAPKTPRGGERQSVFYRSERHAALVQLDGEQTIGTVLRGWDGSGSRSGPG
jgi:hypothetical protein